MGYEGTEEKFKFYKNLFSPQWKFLIHTLLQCLSRKRSGWNEFAIPIATALVCLATNQIFNFSKYIWEGLLGNLRQPKTMFCMYPRFLQLLFDKLPNLTKTDRIHLSKAHNKKVFSNMKTVSKFFSGVVTPLFSTMVEVTQPTGEGSSIPLESQPTSATQQSTQHNSLPNQSQMAPSHTSHTLVNSSEVPVKTYSLVYQRKRTKRAPSPLRPSSPNPSNSLQTHLSEDKTQREHTEHQPKLKEVVTKELSDHVERAHSTHSIPSVDEDRVTGTKTRTTATPENSLSTDLGFSGGPRSHGTKGGDDVHARHETSPTNTLYEPFNVGTLHEEGESSFHYTTQELNGIILKQGAEIVELRDEVKKLKGMVLKMAQKQKLKKFALKPKKSHKFLKSSHSKHWKRLKRIGTAQQVPSSTSSRTPTAVNIASLKSSEMEATSAFNEGEKAVENQAITAAVGTAAVKKGKGFLKRKMDQAVTAASYSRVKAAKVTAASQKEKTNFTAARQTEKEAASRSEQVFNAASTKAVKAASEGEIGKKVTTVKKAVKAASEGEEIDAARRVIFKTAAIETTVGVVKTCEIISPNDQSSIEEKEREAAELLLKINQEAEKDFKGKRAMTQEEELISEAAKKLEALNSMTVAEQVVDIIRRAKAREPITEVELDLIQRPDEPKIPMNEIHNCREIWAKRDAYEKKIKDKMKVHEMLEKEAEIKLQRTKADEKYALNLLKKERIAREQKAEEERKKQERSSKRKQTKASKDIEDRAKYSEYLRTKHFTARVLGNISVPELANLYGQEKKKDKELAEQQKIKEARAMAKFEKEKQLKAIHDKNVDVKEIRSKRKHDVDPNVGIPGNTPTSSPEKPLIRKKKEGRKPGPIKVPAVGDISKVMNMPGFKFDAGSSDQEEPRHPNNSEQNAIIIGMKKEEFKRKT